MNNWTRLSVFSICSLALLGCTNDHRMAPVREIATDEATVSTHVVDHGETLYMIAWRYEKDLRDLAAINNLSEPYMIRVGQVLRLDGHAAPRMANVHHSSSSWVADSGPPSQSGSAKPKPSTGWVLEKDSTPGVQASQLSVKKEIQSPKQSTVATSTGRWQWPAEGKTQKSPENNGIDIQGAMNAPVLATADGQVVYSGEGLRGYGKLVILKHDDQYLSAYGHNSRLLVSEGDRVKVGQKIAEMGRSGSDEVKLHFEIRKAGKPQDPLQYLPMRARS